MKGFNRYHCLLLIFGFISCNDNRHAKSESEIRYRYFNLENKGWKSMSHSQKVDDINFSATEVPIVYYLLKDKTDRNLIEVDSLYEENKRERIIEFVFQNERQEDLLKEKYTNREYKESVEYMSFSIQKDFLAVTSKNDTVQCSGVLFERNFNVSPDNKVMLFFSGIDANDKIQLVYRDNLFKKGTLKFRFKEPIIKL